ncbi:MAG: tRNA (cytidine(56)-2'-O)-methyltransferase [Candidatus Thorarchaeota archaeon]
MVLSVLRLSHRISRDKRITTHLALTARAFGTSKFFYTGDKDSNLENSSRYVTEEWGGDFSISFVESATNFIKEWKRNEGIVVHLTMYGIELSNQLKLFRSKINNNILIVVGGSKVPGHIFQLADYNIAIGHQPHSEVSALAVFLDNLTDSKARKKKYKNAKTEIIPTEKGKKTKNIQDGSG